MNVTDGDANLVRAFDLVSRCCVEVNGLTDTLDELFEEELGQLPPSLAFRQDGKAILKYGNEASGWLQIQHAMSFPLKKKRSADPSMFIGYQISMHGDGILLEDKAPLLHVFLWEVPCDLSEVYVCFPIGEEAAPFVDSSRLIVWGEGAPSDWTKRQWTYSIKLTAMNNRQNLLESVVNPALALLQMKSAIEALPDNLPGLVFYPDSVISASVE